MVFQSSFMLTTVQPFATRLVPALVELLPICRSAVVGPFPLRIGVMYVQAKRAPVPAVVHCSICRSPSELPNAAIGRRPICRFIADRLALLVVDKVDLWQLISTGTPSRTLELQSCRCCRSPARAECRRRVPPMGA